MATLEPPPPRKRKVAETTPPDVCKSVKETTRTLYVFEDGRYVPLKKDGGYVAPPPPPPAPDSDSDTDSDRDVDPVLKAEYYRQIQESDGFDLNVSIPNGSLFPYPHPHDEDEIGICARVGLHCFNFRKGTNFRLSRLEKYNVMFAGLMTYYITADVIDPSSSSTFVFQTRVTQTTLHHNEDFRIETECCRLKGSEAEEKGCHWNSEAIDDFYKGDLIWLPGDALVQSSDKRHQFYELQDSDISENDWLNLYADYAFYTLWEYGLTKLKFAAPLEIEKVVVQTHEAMEPKEMLKAGNAVFYISFRDCGLTEDHRAVVRRTTDGHPAHLCLEVKCPVEGKSGCSICN